MASRGWRGEVHPGRLSGGSEKKVDSFFELVLKAKIKKNHEEWR
jgi:hypothetical protein